jgi:hypothetical protein
MQKKRDRREYNRKWYLAHKETENAGSREYYADHSEKYRQVAKEWRKEHPDKVKEFKHRHTMKYLDKSIAKIKNWKLTDPNRTRERGRFYIQKVKKEFASAYGKVCYCCGESRLPFLTCDHINGDGSADRKNNFSGVKLYLKARREGYPKDRYRLACMNCNFATRFGKICPHESERLQEGLRSVAG